MFTVAKKIYAPLVKVSARIWQRKHDKRIKLLSNQLDNDGC